MLKNWSWRWDEVIHKDICDHIVKNTDWDKKENASTLDNEGKNRLTNSKIRKTDVVFADRLSIAGCILNNYILMANKFAEWNFDLMGIEEPQIGRYTSGGHYKYHVDSFAPNQENLQRKLSAILFLSDPKDYKGGLFEFKKYQLKEKTIKKGSIIVFPSFLEHRVAPVTSGTRYSAVCWAYGKAFI